MKLGMEKRDEEVVICLTRNWSVNVYGGGAMKLSSSKEAYVCYWHDGYFQFCTYRYPYYTVHKKALIHGYDSK